MRNEKLPPNAPGPYGHNYPQQGYGQYNQQQPPVQQPRQVQPVGYGYPGQPPVQPQPPQKGKGRMVALWIALVVLILCAVALFVLFVLPAITGEPIVDMEDGIFGSSDTSDDSSDGTSSVGGGSTTAPSGSEAPSVTWRKTSTETVMVPEYWPSNFDTTHSVYRQLERNVPNEEEYGDTRIEVEIIETGYIYYHWCRNARFAPKEPINRTATTQESAEFHTFHAYYSTRDLMASGNHIEATYHAGSETDNPGENGAYHQPNSSVCCDSYWYHPLKVTTYEVTTYEAEYD